LGEKNLFGKPPPRGLPPGVTLDPGFFKKGGTLSPNTFKGGFPPFLKKKGPRGPPFGGFGVFKPFKNPHREKMFPKKPRGFPEAQSYRLNGSLCRIGGKIGLFLALG